MSNNLTNDIYTSSYYLNTLNWDVLPIPTEDGKRSKGPKDRAWPTKAIERQYPEDAFLEPDTNRGVLAGAPHNLTDLDCDDLLLLLIVEYVLERFGLLDKAAGICGRASKPRSHYFFYPDEPLPYWSTSDPLIKGDHAMLIEYRCRTKAGGRGHETMIPPSVHPSGEAVEWDLAPTPDNCQTVNAKDLLRAVKWTAGITLMAKYFPESDRHFAVRAWANVLRNGNYALEEAQFIIAVACKHAIKCFEDSDRHVKDVYETGEGEHLYGWPYLEKKAGYDSKVLHEIANILDLRAQVETKTGGTDVDSYLTVLQSQTLESFPNEPMVYLIDDVIPKGCFVEITGGPGSGKSTLALDFAFEISKKHWVVYLDRENPRQIIQARFSDRGGNTPEKLIYHGTWNKAANGDLLEPPRPDDPLYERLVAKLVDPVFIFDTLSEFSDADENDNSAMTKVLRPFRKLCSLGATVIILHHTGKDPNSFYRGAEAIRGKPDVAWKVHPTIEDGLLKKVKLENFKTRTGNGKPIEYLMQQGRLIRATKGKDEILRDLMWSNPPMSQDDFENFAMKQHRFTRSRIRQFISEGLESGEVVSVPDPLDKRKRSLQVKLKQTTAAGVSKPLSVIAGAKEMSE